MKRYAPFIAPPVVAVIVILIYTMSGGGGFLSTIEEEIKSKDSTRIAAALSTLNTELEEGKIAKGADTARALTLARLAVGGKSNKAENTAIKILVRHKDPKAGRLFLKRACKRKLSTKHRIRMFDSLIKLGPKIVEDHPTLVSQCAKVASTTKNSKSLRAKAVQTIGVFWCKRGGEILQKMARNTKLPLSLRVVAISAINERVTLGGTLMKTLLDLQADEDQSIVQLAEAGLLRARTRTSIFQLYGLQGGATKAFGGAGKIVGMSAKRDRQMMGILDDMDKSPAKKKAKTHLSKILPKLGSSDEQDRIAAAFDLGELGNPSAIPALVKSLRDNNHSVRHTAARAIVKLSGKGKKSVDLSTVIPLLKDKKSLVRENASYLLGELKAKESAESIQEALKAEKNGRAIRAMVRALGKIKGEDSLKAIHAARTRSSGKTAIACVKAMIPFKKDAGKFLVKALDSSSKKVRGAAQKALKEISGNDFGADKAKWNTWLTSESK